MRVGADAVADELAEDVRAAALGRLPALQHEQRGALAERDAGAAAIERAAGLAIERLQRVEARVRHPAERIGAAAQHRRAPGRRGSSRRRCRARWRPTSTRSRWSGAVRGCRWRGRRGRSMALIGVSNQSRSVAVRSGGDLGAIGLLADRHAAGGRAEQHADARRRRRAPPCATLRAPAVSASSDVRAAPRASVRGTTAGGVRSRTSAASVVRKPALGNNVSAPMPQRPSRSAAANVSTPVPSALMLPTPVMAMRLTRSWHREEAPDPSIARQQHVDHTHGPAGPITRATSQRSPRSRPGVPRRGRN